MAMTVALLAPLGESTPTKVFWFDSNVDPNQKLRRVRSPYEKEFRFELENKNQILVQVKGPNRKTNPRALG